MTRSLLVLVAVLSACGSPSAAAIAEPTSARSDNLEGIHEQAASSAGQMVIAPFSLQAEGTVIEVGADGAVSVAGQVSGQLLPNGSFVNEGEVLMSLSDDTINSGGREVGTLAEDGTANVEGFTLRYDDHGRLQGGDGDGPAFVLTPADTPARRAAMLLTLVLAL